MLKYFCLCDISSPELIQAEMQPRRGLADVDIKPVRSHLLPLPQQATRAACRVSASHLQLEDTYNPDVSSLSMIYSLNY